MRMADWINGIVKEEGQTEVERKLYKRILKALSRENGMDTAIKLMKKTYNFTLFLDEFVKIQRHMRKYRLD